MNSKGCRHISSSSSPIASASKPTKSLPRNLLRHQVLALIHHLTARRTGVALRIRAFSPYDEALSVEDVFAEANPHHVLWRIVEVLLTNDTNPEVREAWRPRQNSERRQVIAKEGRSRGKDG
jgi:hypothetical protein